ncbi:HTH-type transcriptional repressor RspR [Rhodoplanes serenus]|uniref:HTH-type transcriptional repressor RspR n=1 Tax=Rhodoplanes serenus TaxID=200615 RepID=A0A3S4B2I3_9BRAD|nr:GntR family transcriptional regulator [Rhodoplanes serenus]VCU07444.1 HTH-type transcriptional repressor RspR [Rhodoplanes serenus]
MASIRSEARAAGPIREPGANQPGTNEPGAKTLAEAVFRKLRQDILKCRFRPGEKLLLESLREIYGTGLAPLREALSRLSSTGLVIAEGQRGFRVAPMSTDDLVDLVKARVWVEAQALSAAIARGDRTWQAEIVAAAQRLGVGTGEAANRVTYLDDDWVKRHSRFHAALVAAAGSRYLLEFRAALFEMTDRYFRLAVIYKPNSRDIDAEHRAIMEAVLDRDAVAAIRLTEDHLMETIRTLLVQDPATRADADGRIARLRREIEEAMPAIVPAQVVPAQVGPAQVGPSPVGPDGDRASRGRSVARKPAGRKSVDSKSVDSKSADNKSAEGTSATSQPTARRGSPPLPRA